MLEQNSILQEEEKLGRALAGLREESSTLSARALERMWRERPRPLWRGCLELYQLLSRRLGKLGESFLAIEVAREGLTWFPADLALVHALALAHARSGAPGLARELIASLGKRGADIPEATALLARTHKELFLAAEAPADRREHLRAARTHYRETFENASPPRAAAGANAAAMTLLDGDAAAARELAQRASALLERSGPGANDGEDAYGRQATLALCSLLRGDFPRAADEFGELRALAAGSWTRLVSTRRQARILIAKLAETTSPEALPSSGLTALRAALDHSLTLPRVMLFAGHMVDLPGRSKPRFPATHEAGVKAEIARRLEEENVGFGFSAAACGADILFLEALLERGGEAHVVLPFSREEFRRRSVARVPAHAGWGQRYDRVIEAATTFLELTDSFSLLPENAVNYANRVSHGRARRRAVEFDTELRALAVWDGKPRRPGHPLRSGAQGTLDCVQQWQANGYPVEILAPLDGDTATVFPGQMPPPPATVAGYHPPARRLDEAIRATLCGEWVPSPAAGLRTEKRRLAARRAFFDRVAGLLEPFRTELLDLTVDNHRFRLLFAELLPAARAARALRAGLAAGAVGSSRRFAARFGLHAGPVARMENALLGGHAEPAGAHWQKAERLVTLAAPGRIHLSREAAALLAVESGGRNSPDGGAEDDWHCEYQGRVTFGEPFGQQGIYAL